MFCHKDFFWLLLSVDERLQDFHFDTHFLLRGVGGGELTGYCSLPYLLRSVICARKINACISCSAI